MSNAGAVAVAATDPLASIPPWVIVKELRDRAFIRRLVQAGIQPRYTGNPDLASVSTEELRGLIGAIRSPLDNRVEADAAPVDVRVRQNLASTAALIDVSRLQESAADVTVTAPSLRTVFPGLCPDVRFANQPSAAIGTAFLVGPRIVATAFHNVADADALERFRVVFGFSVRSGIVNTQLKPNDVYKAIQLLDHRITASGGDWALVLLDREVVGRTAVVRRDSGTIADGTSLYVIGYPSGLPEKFAGGASVGDNTPADAFRASLNVFRGSSGSPVFNASTHEVEGIVDGGHADFEFSPLSPNCQIPHFCAANKCTGDLVVRITEVPLV